MGTSDITVSALVAVPRVQGNKLEWTVTDNWPKGSHYSLGAVEVHASLTNDRATATKVGEGITDFLHTGLDEEVIWYYWTKARNKVGVGSYGPWHPVSATSGVPGQTLGQAGIGFTLSNGKLVATVAGNALTIAIKTAAGTDPSAADPVYVGFRSSTLSTGGYVTRKIAAALSLVVSSGSTLGQLNSVPFRVWVALFDDGGTIRLAAITCANGYVFPLAEYGLASATADGGAGGADLAGIFYASQAITTKPFRLIGLLDWESGLATAGTWNVGPDVISLKTPDIPTPGSVVQHLATYSASFFTTANTITYDDSIPQKTEGVACFSNTITPVSRINYVENECEMVCTSSVAEVVTSALFRGTEADAIAAAAVSIPVADTPSPLVLKDLRQFSSASAIAYAIRAGAQTGTMGVNGTSAARRLGGAMRAYHSTKEIMV